MLTSHRILSIITMVTYVLPGWGAAIAITALSLITHLTVAPAYAAESVYALSVPDIRGVSRPLVEFKGKVALVVNTASRCGFTSQYAGLEELYQRFRERGFVVLAFPSNDFGGQEPGSNEEIKKFCELRFKTTFPVFAKGAVSGAGKQPVYRLLTESSDPKFRGDPGWNFVKFLVNREGQVVARFSSMTAPLDSDLVQAVERELSGSAHAEYSKKGVL